MVKRFSAMILTATLLVPLLGTEAGAFSGKTGGLNRRLVSILRQVESHFGRDVTVTSGCRSYSHNRRIGGARESYHLRCQAADIKINGVGKGKVANYVATLAQRGGLGTYCHDGSIHVDIGPRRQWYWGCAGQRNFSQGSFHRSTARIKHWKRRR
jgi:hypothetical protein